MLRTSESDEMRLSSNEIGLCSLVELEGKKEGEVGVELGEIKNRQ